MNFTSDVQSVSSPETITAEGIVIKEWKTNINLNASNDVLIIVSQFIKEA